MTQEELDILMNSPRAILVGALVKIDRILFDHEINTNKIMETKHFTALRSIIRKALGSVQEKEMKRLDIPTNLDCVADGDGKISFPTTPLGDKQ